MATNLFSKAATYRKKHKGMTMPEAVKAVSKGAKVTGPKKSKVTGTKKAKVTGTKRPAKVGKTVVLVQTKGTRKTTGGAISRAHKLTNQIQALEAKRSQIKGRDTQQLKDIYSLQINKLHNQLKTIQRSLKS